MTSTRTRDRLLAGTALTLLIVSQPGQAAQPVALPEVTVTSPSPILGSQTSGTGDTADSSIGVLPVVTQSFSPITVITQSEINRQQPKTLGDALFDKPGITGTSYAPGAANRPIIRGLDNYRVRIQENGIGVQDVSPLGEDHGVPINPLVSDRIEVIRGPATLRYGSQAIGGVVSSENNRIPTFIPQGGYRGQILSGYGTVDNGVNAAASVDAGAGNVGFHADGFKTKADNYNTPRGVQANSGNETQGGAFGLSYIGDTGYVGFAYSHYDSLYHIPGGESAESSTVLNPRQDKLTSKGEFHLSNGPFETLRFWLGASNYKHNEIGYDEDGINGVRATFKNREFEGRMELEQTKLTTTYGMITGALGVSGNINRLGTSGEAGGLLAPTSTRVIGGYIFEQLDAGNGLKFQAAARIEHSQSSGTATAYPPGYLPTFSATGEVDGNGDPVLAADPASSYAKTRDFTPKSVSLGVSKTLPYAFVATLTGQYVERAPSAPELYSRGSHDATGTFEIGNPNLGLERAKTVEFGIRRSEGPIRLDATGYYTRFDGYIYKRVTGVTCGDEFTSCGQDTELQQIIYSQQNATFFGAELSSQIDLIPVRSGFIGVEGQYDFVRARFDDGTNAPRIPPHRLGGGLFWRDGGWFARVNLLHAFDHTAIAPFETPTAGYNNLRAEISTTQQIDPSLYGFSAFTLGLRGTNLLNEEMRNSASFKKDEILLPGRNVALFFSARF